MECPTQLSEGFVVGNDGALLWHCRQEMRKKVLKRDICVNFPFVELRKETAVIFNENNA